MSDPTCSTCVNRQANRLCSILCTPVSDDFSCVFHAPQPGATVEAQSIEAQPIAEAVAVKPRMRRAPFSWRAWMKQILGIRRLGTLNLAGMIRPGLIHRHPKSGPVTTKKGNYEHLEQTADFG